VNTDNSLFSANWVILRDTTLRWKLPQRRPKKKALFPPAATKNRKTEKNIGTGYVSLHQTA